MINLGNAKKVGGVNDTTSSINLGNSKKVNSTESTTQPVDSNSEGNFITKSLDFISENNPSYLLADYLFKRFTSPSEENIAEAEATLKNVPKGQTSTQTEKQLSEKRGDLAAKSVKTLTGEENMVQGLFLLKDLGYTTENSVDKNTGETFLNFKKDDKIFTPEELTKFNTEKKLLSSKYNERLKEAEDNLNAISVYHGKRKGTAIPQFFGRFFGVADFFKSQEQIDAEKAIKNQIKEIQKEKQEVLGLYNESLETFKTVSGTPNQETGVIPNDPLKNINIKDKESILYNFTSANTDFDKLKYPEVDTTQTGKFFKSHELLNFIDAGIEIQYANEPNFIDSKKESFSTAILKDDAKLSTEQQKLAFIGIKSEQGELSQSIDRYTKEKQALDNNLQIETQNIKNGKKLSKEDEILYNNSTLLSNLLGQNIEKQKERVGYLQEVIDKHTPSFKHHLEEQAKLNEIAEVLPVTAAMAEGVKSLTRIPKRVGLFAYDVSDYVQDNGIENKLLRDELYKDDASPLFKRTDSEGNTVYKKAEELESFSLLDEEGNFKITLDLPGLAFNSVKMAGESFVLGGGMVGARALMAGTADKWVAKTFARGVAEEVGISAGINPLAATATSFEGSLLKYLGKDALRTAGKATAELGIWGGEAVIGSMIPSVFMFGDEMLSQQLEQGLTFDQAFVMSTLLGSIEGFTERLAPNEMSFVKTLIGNGEIRTLKELGKNEIYKSAIEKTFLRMTGKPITQNLYNALTLAGKFTKEGLLVGLEEGGEEVAGLALQDMAANPLGRSYNPEYQGEELTVQAVTNTMVATMATMLPMMGQGGYSKVQQYRQSQNLAQFKVGTNPTPYYEATLNLFKEGTISEQEFQRRSQLINQYTSKAKEAILGSILNPNARNYTEQQRQNYQQQIFSKSVEIDNLKKAVIENPEDDSILKLYDDANLNLQDILQKGLFKTDEERVDNTINSLDFYVSPSNVKNYDIDNVESLIQKFEQYEKTSTEIPLKNKYLEKIALLKNREIEINKEEAEAAKTATEKAQEAEQQGTVKINTTTGEKEFQIGKKYIAGRQLVFNKTNPIRFPEVTFLGYKKDEEGNVVEENGSPVVVFNTKDNNGNPVTLERPASVFSDYKLGTEEALNSTEEGKFYNKFKNKKFLVSLRYPTGTPNRFYNFLSKKFNLNPEDVLEGVLSIEQVNGKPVLYFNFSALDKKGNRTEGSVNVTDEDIANFGKFKDKALFRPKSKEFTTTAGNKIINKGQYEDATAEDLDNLSLFSDKEQAEYDEYLQNKNFEQLKAQRLQQEGRRRSYIQEYLNSISEPLNKVVEQITKYTTLSKEYSEFLEVINSVKNLLTITSFDKISDVTIAKILPTSKLKEYNKIETPYKKLEYLKNYITTKVEATSKNLESLNKKLTDLETKKAKYQSIIDEERDFLESLDLDDLDYTETLTKQLSKKRKALKEALKLNEELISSSRTTIDSLLDIINSIKETVSKLLNFVNPIDTQNLINTYRTSISDNEVKITELKKENENISRNIKYYNKLITYLKLIEAERDRKTKELKSAKLREFIFGETKTELPPAVSTSESDVEVHSLKKYFTDLFVSTTSWGYNYEKGLQKPDNNYANARLDFFFNNQKDFSQLQLLPITQKNAKEYGLEKVLTTGQEATDIQMVVVRYGKNKEIIFVDMNGKDIATPSADNVIYTPLPLIDKIEDLKDSEGNLKYNEKDLQNIPKDKVEEVLKLSVQEFAKFRATLLSQDKPTPLSITGISRGLPQYAGTEGETFVRNPVRGFLLPENYTSYAGTIILADKKLQDSELGSVEDFNGRKVDVPLGRPILFNTKSKTFQFLDNHKLSNQQREALKRVLYELALGIKNNFEKRILDPTVDVKIIDTKYTKFLSGVIYWRNPNQEVNGKKQDNPVANQMWIDFEEDGTPVFKIGGEKISVSIASILEQEGNNEMLDVIANQLFHNVNKSLFGKSFVEYYVDTKDKLQKREWKSYEDYLLADSFPDKSPRNSQEIPLTTNVIKNEKPFNEDNTFENNFNPQYRSRYFTFKSGVVVKKDDTKKEETPPTQGAPNENSNSVKSVVKEYLETAFQGIVEEVRETYKERLNKWIPIAANLKEGVKYSVLASNPAKNGGNESLFSFNVKIKDGKITVENYENTSAENILDYFNNNNIVLNNESIAEVLNFFAYTSATIPALLQESLQWGVLPGKVKETPIEKTPTEPTFTEGEELLKQFSEEEAPKKKLPKFIKRKGDENKGNYRLAKGEAKAKENIEAARQWFKQRFPNLDFNTVKGLIDGKAWGQFVKNGIILSEAAEVGTVYHEAFEVVAGLFLNKRQWNNLQREFKSREGSFVDRETNAVVRYKDATPHQIKEELAEEYRDYELSDAKSILEGQYNRNSLFRRMWNSFKSLLFGDPKDIKDLFSKISNGHFQNATSVQWNRPFNLDKNYRIANLQDDLFYFHLNKSLTLSILEKSYGSSKSFDTLFNLSNKGFEDLYSSVKQDLNSKYLDVQTTEGALPIYEAYGYSSLEDLLDDYDEFFDVLVQTYNEDVETLEPNETSGTVSTVIDDIITNIPNNLNDEEAAIFVRNRIKDALLSYQYIQANWENVVKENKKYLRKFKIEFEENKIEDEDVEVSLEENEATQSEQQESVGKGEYTKDPFSLSLKDTANSRIKLLIATLPKSFLGKAGFDEQDIPFVKKKLNTLGLPEIEDFSKSFRKVISTVIAETNIIEQLEAIKKAIPNNPELKFLYKALGGTETAEEISKNKDLFKLRIAFNQSLNKQRFGFSRLLLREEQKGRGKNKIVTLVSNIIDTLQTSSGKAVLNRYLNNFKPIAINKGWVAESRLIEIPASAVNQVSRDLTDNIKTLESLGFNIPYDIKQLNTEETVELTSIVNNILTFIGSGKANLKDNKSFNFPLLDLANFEYKITKDAGETQHRNIENQAQSNDISQNALSQVFKKLNNTDTLANFISALPRFNDIFTQNALWREIYFQNGEKNDVKLSVESVEGMIDTRNKGLHTSKLPFSSRLLQEFLYNIHGDSKNFRTPGFYVITPADSKTEVLIKWGKVLADAQIANDTESLFNSVLRGYLTDEINLARELVKDDRGLKAYNEKAKDTDFVTGRLVKNSLRFFHDILQFDYTDVIDVENIDVNEWIDNNKDNILKGIEAFINQEVEDTLSLFEQEQIVVLETDSKGRERYSFEGLESATMAYLDKEFGTNLVQSLENTGRVYLSPQQLRDIIRYRSVNYFININEQSKLFFGDFGQFGDLSKRVKSFVSTRETTTHDTNLTVGEVFTNLAKKFYNVVRVEDALGNVEEIALEEDIPGFQTFETEFQGSTIQDVDVVQSSIENITKAHKDSISEDVFFSPFNTLPKNIQKFVSNMANEISKAFEKVTETDGQAYMTLPLYRQFLLRSTMWTDDLEDLFQYHMAYERQARNNYPDTNYGNSLKELDEKIIAKGNPNIEKIKNNQDVINYPVIKPIGAGVRPGNKFITTLDKCSVVALHYQMLENSPALEMYTNAIDNNNNYFRYKSAHKVGTPKDMSPTYNENGTPNLLKQTDTLSFADYNIQVETRSLKDKVTRGTQLLKLAFLNLMESSIPKDYIKSIEKQFEKQIEELKTSFNEESLEEYYNNWNKLKGEIVTQAKQEWENLTEEVKKSVSPIHNAVSNYNQSVISLTNRYFNEISEDYSLEKVGEGQFRIKDFTKFSEALIKQLQDRDAADNLLKQIKVENNKLKQPFDFMIGADKLEPVLMSIINKNVVQPKVKGKSLAQIASTFFEKTPRTYVEKIDNKDGTFSYKNVENPENYPNKKNLIMTSNELLFYGDYYVEDSKGNTSKATQEQIDNGQAKIANFIEIYLPPIFKDKLGNYITDFSKIDKELLSAVGFRIPNQEMSSTENIRVKGFLPLEYQNGVVVPSSITTKAGSDFDIDKLNIYLSHYMYSAKQDKVIKVPYLDNSNSTTEERYVNFVRENLNKYKEQLEDDEIAEDLKEQLWKNLGKIWSKTIREVFKNLPEFNESKKQFQTVKESVKKLKNKSVGKQILEILYSKEDNLDKYETIIDVLNIESERQLFQEQQAISELQIEIDQLFSLNEIEAQTFRSLKLSMKNTLGYASLKGKMKETSNDVIANYIFQYNIQIPQVPSYTEYLTLSIDEQNTTKALENKFVDSIKTLINLPENFSRLVNTNNTTTLEKLAEYIEGLKEKAQKDIKEVSTNSKKQFLKYGSAISNALTRYSFQIGKEGIGIGAVGMTNQAVNQLVDTSLLDPTVSEISLYFPTLLVNGENTISFTRDAEGKWISNNISEFINAFVDIAKDPFIIKINGTLETAGTYIIANKLGIPLKHAALLINQPSVIMYEKALEFSKSPIGRMRILNANGKPYSYAAMKVHSNFGAVTEDYKARVFSITELEDMIANSNNLSDVQKNDQAQLLKIYLKLKSLNNDMRRNVNTYNFDTDQATFITDVISKNQRIASYLKDPSIVSNTSGTFFKTIKNAVNNYTDTLKPLFKSFSGEFYPALAPIFRNMFLITDSDVQQRVLSDVKKGLANFLILTANNSALQKQTSKLMIEKETSVNKRIKELKKKMDKGEIEYNFAIAELYPLFSDTEKKTNNLTLFNKESTSEYVNLIVNSLKELEENPETKQLAEDIYTVSLLQSGLNQSFLSISQFIPESWFTPLAQTALSSYNRDLLPSFQQWYYANKWKDSKFTAKSYASPYNYPDISDNPLILYPAVTLEDGVPKINNLHLSQYQLSSYSLSKEESESKEMVKKWDISIYQRVEFDNGDPILIKTDKGYSFVYRQVTPLGDGQNLIEYSPKSLVNDNVNETPQSEVIANLLGSTDFQTTSLKEVEEGLVNPSTPTKVIEQPIQNKEGRTVAIIGTAGRSQVPTLVEWNNMLKDAESRVNSNDTLISGGAAFADHIAVKLFLEGKVKGLKLRLPAKIVNNQFVGGYGTAGGTANYYHKPFSKLLGVDTIAEIQQAIDKGAEVTYETETSNKAMFIRNEKVAKESNAMIAYTYGESNEPADGGTKDTWNKSKYSDKVHVPISKIKFVEQPINKEIKLNENLTPKANIPQNLVSGVESFGTKQEANPEAKKALGANPHSIDMIEAGFRTRTTRSVGEMEKYNIKVGDIIKQFGKSADGNTKNILTRVTAIHSKGTPGFLGTWNKEGWTQEGIKTIERFKDGAAAIEFELLTQEQPIVEETKEDLPGLNNIPDPQC